MEKPKIKHKFPSREIPLPNQLLSRNREDIETLLASEALQEAFLTKYHPDIKSNGSNNVDNEVSNLDLTSLYILEESKNLALNIKDKKISEIYNLKNELNELVEKSIETERVWKEKEKIMKESLVPFSDEAILNKLNLKISLLESKSELILNQLLNDDNNGNKSFSDLNDFVKKYRNTRKNFHLLNQYRERWNEGRISGRMPY